MQLTTQVSAVKNEIIDLGNKQHIYYARKRRLDVEKAKVQEERSGMEGNLSALTAELSGVEERFTDLNSQILSFRKEREVEEVSLNNLNSEIENLEILIKKNKL